MLRALARKGLADLRSRRLQSSLLFVIIVLASAAATMSLTLQDSASNPFESILDEANGAHLWVFGADDQTRSVISDHPDVKETSGPFERSEAELIVADGSHSSILWATPSPQPSVSPALVTEGRWLSPGALDEVVLEGGLARESDLGLGDRASFETASGRVELTVVGLAASTSQTPYPIWKPALAYVTPEALIDIAPVDRIDPVFAVRLQDDRADSFAFLGSLEGPDGSRLRVRSTTWEAVQSSFQAQVSVAAVIVAAFSLFAMIAVGIVLANVVSSQVLAQYREIGMLKAIGLKPSQVSMLLVGQQLVLGAVALALGLVIGLLTAPWWLSDLAAEVGRSPSVRPSVPLLSVVTVLVLGILLLFTAVPARHAGRVSVVQAVHVGQVRADERTSRTHSLAMRLHLPAPIATGLKDLFSRPLRTWLSIGSTALAVITVMFTLTIGATLDGLRAEPEQIGEGFYDLRVDRVVGEARDLGAHIPSTAPSETEMRAVVDRADVLGTVEVREFRATLAGRDETTGRSYVTRAIEGDLDSLRTAFASGGWPASADELVVGRSLADQLGISVGDTISIARPESTPENPQAEDFAVSGVYIEGANDGQMMMLPMQAIEGVFGDIEFSELWLVLDESADPLTVASDIRSQTAGRVGVTDQIDTIRDEIQDASATMRTALLPLNIVLLAVAAANVLLTLLYTIRERTRDLAILKAIGFTPKQIMATTESSAVVIAAMGAVIGIPLGYLVSTGLLDLIATDAGWADGIAATPAAAWLIVPITLALGVGLGGAWLPARLAVRAPVTDTLRYE